MHVTYAWRPLFDLWQSILFDVNLHLSEMTALYAFFLADNQLHFFYEKLLLLLKLQLRITFITL